MKKFLRVVLIVILLLTIFSVSNGVWNSWQKLNSLKGSQGEIEALKAENKKLENEKAFRQSDFYVEQQAREKLGLGKAGEVTYVGERFSSQSGQANDKAPSSNWQAWINLFQ